MTKPYRKLSTGKFLASLVTAALLGGALAGVVPTAAAAAFGPPLTLYMKASPTGVGHVDLIFGESALSPDAPTKDTPSVWYSVPVVPGANPNTIWEANWRWQPDDGYVFNDVKVTVTFWAASLGGPLNVNGWDVDLYNGATLVASHTDPDVIPTAPGVAAEYTVELGPVSFSGNDLTVQIHPQYIDVDWTHLILFDSVDFPSRIEITGAADVTPPTQVTNLAVTGTTASSVSLAWDAATDDVGVDHYNVYRGTTSGSLSPVGTAAGTSFLDTGLSAATTYFYEVSAVDAAGNEGSPSSEVSATTDSSDTTPPTILTTDVTAGATTLQVSWTTDEPTTGLLEIGTTTAYGDSETTSLGTEHAVTVGNLNPGTTYHLKITATDTSANAADTGDFTAATSPDMTLFLHNRLEGDVDVLYMNEFDEAGDYVGRGYNLLGSLAATLESQTGAAPLGTLVHVFPADRPTNPGLALDVTGSVNATVYVQFPTALPTVGTVHSESAGVVQFNLTLYANDDQVVGSDTVQLLVRLNPGWVPLNFSFTPQLSLVERGTLRAEIQADVATTSYLIGYEGTAASFLTLPLEPTLPLSAAAGADTSGGRPIEDSPVQFTAEASGGIEPYTYAWAFSDGSTSTLKDPVVTFGTPGLHTGALTVTDANGATAASTVAVRVLQRDFVNNARVVVAVIDSGINPYHENFRRPDAEMPLSDFADAQAGGVLPRVIDLTFGSDYTANVAADSAEWASIGEEELVYFSHTNVFGVTMGNSGTPILDDPDDGHGTATSDTVLRNFPDAVILMVENDNLALSSGIPRAFEWAVAQPWIDVISASLGVPGNAPEPLFLYDVPGLAKKAWESGKVTVVAAGNDPSPLITDGLDGSPWTISVTGTHEDGAGKQILSAYTYSDFGSDFTVTAATHTSVDGEGSISGTSFACPTVAGTAAGAIHTLRANAGYTGGISGTDLVPSTGVDNGIVRSAMNKTAVYNTDTGYVATLVRDHAVPPVAPWLVVGWGHLDGDQIPDIVDAVETNNLTLPPPPDQKGLAKVYMEATYALREAYWSAWLAANGGAGVPGPELNVQPVSPPIETPHPYPDNADLTWTITHPGAEAVSVHFEEFDVETGFDFVFVEDAAGNVYGAYTGEGRLSFWSSYVPGDTVVIRLVSDTIVNAYGFEVHEIDVL